MLKGQVAGMVGEEAAWQLFLASLVKRGRERDRERERVRERGRQGERERELATTMRRLFFVHPSTTWERTHLWTSLRPVVVGPPALV